MQGAKDLQFKAILSFIGVIYVRKYKATMKNKCFVYSEMRSNQATNDKENLRKNIYRTQLK